MLFADLLAPERCVSCRRRGTALCVACAGLLRPATVPRVRHVDRLLAPWVYEASARDLVLSLKLRSLAYAARPIAAAISTEVARHGTRAQAVTWVPARRADVRRRGFDHARLIAEDLAGRLGLPAEPLVERRGSQRDQAGLSRLERTANLTEAFSARSTARPVLVVDDLVTTGATLAACARALRTAGAPLVEGAVGCIAE